MTWRLERFRGSAAEFHGRALPDPLLPSVWAFEVTAPAIVLGSSQPESDLDLDACRRLGVEVVRRRSGGGAVLLMPGEVVWVDVLIPVGHELWSHDIGRSSRWLGESWASALGRGEVHDGPMVVTPWSSKVCFAGVGPGEVLVEGRKVVGVSQRRTRVGARFQCAALGTWDPAAIASLLALDASSRAALIGAIRDAVSVVALDGLVERLVSRLP